MSGINFSDKMPLPKVGRWIKISYERSNLELKAEILSHCEIEGSQWDLWSGFRNTVEKCAEIRYFSIILFFYCAEIRYDDGTVDSMDEASFARCNWRYIEAPKQEELRAAEDKSFNRAMGGLSCNSCGCDTKKMMQCAGCHKVFYCDANCQKADWRAHKSACKREKVVLRANPRYPLPSSCAQLASVQARAQVENNKLLRDALAGRFTVRHTGSMWFLPEQDGGAIVENPKSGVDLLCLERYKLIIRNKEFNFKWRGTCTPSHSIPEGIPTACDTFLYMEMMDEKVKQGGLHYMASMEDVAGTETFWYMLINFNTFGTVAPFHAPCHCNPSNKDGQMPPKKGRLRRRWDKMFKRAKANPHDVQCMFADTEIGCQNFSNCPFKHDVEVTTIRNNQD